MPREIKYQFFKECPSQVVVSWSQDELFDRIDNKEIPHFRKGEGKNHGSDN